MSYARVPKAPLANVEYRRNLLQRCMADPNMRAGVRRACAEDILFWLNTFGWTYDSRKIDGGQSPHLPFLTYPYQDETIREMERSLGLEDVLIEKSRDMGASWMILALFTHRWQFRPGYAFALVSRTEELVDKTGDPDCLFWKIDYLLARQPRWLVPATVRNRLHLANTENGSVIDGYSTTGNVIRGGRKSAVMLDEFAAFELQDGYKALSATQHATNCRYLNSTPAGATGAFYDMRQSPAVKKLRLHWTRHPEKARGLYYDQDNKPRSPWYDKECKRTPIKAQIAQELDIDYAGAASMFFPADLLDRLIAEDARAPYERGRLDHEHGTEPHFVEDRDGPLLLWTFLKDALPLEEEYVIGADISAGTGATNSVLSVASRRTGEKVAELATPFLAPEQFAELAVALCRFFYGARLIWEMNGPGGQFGKRVIELGWREVYYRQNEQSLSRKQTDTPGWYASRDNRRVLFGQYVSALASGQFLNRHEDALKECRQYVYLPTGDIGNARAQAAGMDPSGARENHGDRPTADALANKLLGESSVAQREKPNVVLPGSMAWRRQAREEEERKAKEW